ncbi:MAG: hypothetical protein ACXW29_04920 [Thermoanaerobaculia bacterium]
MLLEKTQWTDADFEELSWHDNFIHSIHLDAHAFESRLRLEIDHIIQWVSPAPDSYAFWVAPASLVFENVTDLKIDIEFDQSGYQVVIHQVSIHGITRAPVPVQKICFDRPYYIWTIETNWPAGEITFGASGFVQTLHAQPVLTSEQQLSPVERRELIRSASGAV